MGRCQDYAADHLAVIISDNNLAIVVNNKVAQILTRTLDIYLTNKPALGVACFNHIDHRLQVMLGRRPQNNHAICRSNGLYAISACRWGACPVPRFRGIAIEA